MFWISRSSVGLRAAFSRKAAKWEMWSVGLAGALIVGAVLRLIWVMDMEYKGDEAWIFDRTQQTGRTEPFRWVGMGSSAGFRSPGMSIWPFLLLSKVFAAKDPTMLARAVQLLNISAILLLLVFAFRMVCEEEREPWLWAAALVSVNPLAVIFHRKIWPPSVLPVFTVLMLMSWWNRDRRWGAFAWGLVGTCLAQIHMAGFFFSAGFVAWAVLFDRKRVSWLSWLGGSCLGALPMIPWLRYVWTALGAQPIAAFKWTHWLEFRFWMRWATEPFGFTLKYSLGQHFGDFLAYPSISGVPTYFIGLVHLSIIVVAAIILIRATHLLWQDRRSWRARWIGRGSGTAFTVNAAMWGFGIFLTASGLPIHPHYMVILFPLTFVWLARLALGHDGDTDGAVTLGRALLLILFILEGLLSVGFLYYIHVNQGAIHGDYGVAYGAQGFALHPPLDY